MFNKLCREVYRPLLWLSLWLVGLIASSGGQAARADVYRLGPGDVVTVSVQRHPEMSVENATVSAAGKIKMPVIGDVAVNGKSLDQAAQQVARGLDSQLVKPEVTISLKQGRPMMISVLGIVSKPGVYQAAPGWRITEALGVAGGLTVRSQLATATLTRASGKVMPLNLAQIFSSTGQLGAKANNSSSNLILQPGDVLNFVSRAMQVSVTGAVQHPGSYDMPAGEGAVEALALAGGAAPKAALSKARITRADGTVLPVDLLKAAIQGDADSNVKLGIGDIILVPEATDKVTVRGAVQKPGYYDIDDGTTLRVTQALDLAGGTTAKAALTKTIIDHADGTTTPVNLYKVLFGGQRAGDVALASGDIVTIPEARGVTILGGVKTPGTFNVVGGDASHLSDVLAQAGGLTTGEGESRISITRSSPDGQSKAETIEHGTGQNESVQDGDLITVAPLKSQTVFVSGEVKTPGPYELKEGSSLQELLARAGGPTEDAALKRISVRHRDNTATTVDAYAAVREGGQQVNVPLQEGDFIVVPKNTAHVLVMSAVNKAGVYTIPENEPLTVGKALALAGGPKDRAKVKQIAIFRHTPNGVQRYVFGIDQVVNGHLAIDQVMQDQDILYVPEGKQTESTWNNITSAISSFGVLRVLKVL